MNFGALTIQSVTNERKNKMLHGNYKTKKALKESIGQRLRYTETSIFGPEYSDNAQGLVIAGPSDYHKWYAQVYLRDGLITKVT